MRNVRVVIVSFALGAVALAGCGSTGATGASSTTAKKPATTSSAGGAPTTTVAVQSDVLDNLVDPPGGKGSTLSLVRYTIAPGAKLVPHIHPGVQMARIVSGTLTYTVVSGTALVRRAGSTTDTPLTGPAETTLHAGDSVIERNGMVHYGANRTSKKLIIIAALLTEDGHKLAEPVTTTTTVAH